MGYMAHIVLALFAQALVESGVTSGIESWIGVIALVGVPFALAWSAKRAFIAGKFKLGEKVYVLLTWSAPLTYIAGLTVFGWSTLVARWTGHTTSFLVWPDWTAALLIAPFLVFELAAIHARSSIVAPRNERTSWRRFQLRMLAFGIAPLALYFFVSSMIGLSEALRVRIETVGVWSALFVLAVLVAIGWMLPRLLRWTWDMEPVPPGPQRDVLLSVAELARFENPRIYVWKTGNTTANALIVGLTKKTRLVLFSDALLAQMSDSELAAVFVHEMGHAVRRHVPIFAVFLLGFAMLGDVLAQHWFAEDPVWAGVTVIGFLVPGLLAFGWLSRRFELEADLFSLDVLGEVRSLMSALEKVGGQFRDIGGWRHFSTADRVAFLERAQVDPNVGRRLRRDLRRFTYAGIALFVITGAIQAHRLLGALPEDQLHADLALGEYSSARERALHIDGLDRDVVELVARTSELHDREALSAIAEFGLRALRDGDVRAAVELIQLGAQRRDPAFQSILSDLDADVSRSLPPEIEAALAERARTP